jgi:hypothetical protein
MYPTKEEAERLRIELHAWFERNDFLNGLTWRTADEPHAEQDSDCPSDHYFFLSYSNSNFYNIMSGLPTAEPMHSEWLQLFGEFDAIVAKHGFWFERINNRSLNIFGSEQDGIDG